MFKNLFTIRFKDMAKNVIKSFQNNPAGLSSELKFLYKKTRFTEQKIKFHQKLIKFPDAASFIYMYKEIYTNGIYKFKTDIDNPRIIDVGANIGLSILFFKELYPNAKITAFEADPKIFEYLKFNTKGLKDIEFVPKAVFDKIAELDFVSNNCDGGSLFQKSEKSIKVKTCLLSEYLKEPIDFLKIDIEGAELSVLHECIDYLRNVKFLFVEYHSFREMPQLLHELLRIISKAGFRYYITDVPFSPQNPFMKISESNNMDLQLNIACVRDD